MFLNYVSDNYDTDNALPGWQKELIDQRLASIQENPAAVKLIEELLDELGKTKH